MPSLRDDAPFGALRTAMSAACSPSFRIIQFSVQNDHLHLVVEADRSDGLSRGIHALAIRAARAINRALRRRGRVWSGRFHARDLSTPREVRNALVYVLNNVRKHIPGARGMDPRSSAAWFRGWKNTMRLPDGPSPVGQARTWLARVGWRRFGAIDVDEVPRMPCYDPSAGIPRVLLTAPAMGQQRSEAFR
jgi:REP element-mobilizing transposase RayT